MVDRSTVICWMSPFVILGMLGLLCRFYYFFRWKILLANNVDPDQMPQYVVSDRSPQCLPMTLFTGFPVKMG